VIEGTFAIVAAMLAFLVPLAIPLLAQRWRTFGIILALAVAFFAWLTLDLQRAAIGDPTAEPNWIGPFLGGLMLVGFFAGAIAKLVMLIGRRRIEPE